MAIVTERSITTPESFIAAVNPGKTESARLNSAMAYLNLPLGKRPFSFYLTQLFDYVLRQNIIKINKIIGKK